MQVVYIYIDDSGIFHKKSNYFIYAGYVFLDKQAKDAAKREYRALVKKIAISLGRTDEIKSYRLENKHRRALYNVMRTYESLAVYVGLNHIYKKIMDNKKSTHRYKDYALKRMIKGKVEQLISNGLLQSDEDVQFNIYIDEQLTASNGYYSLSDSIHEELTMGIFNHDYGVFHQPLFKGKVGVSIQFCDSSKSYLIQASDILANRHFNSFILKKPKLRDKPNHFQLHLP